MIRTSQSFVAKTVVPIKSENSGGKEKLQERYKSEPEVVHDVEYSPPKTVVKLKS
jgi:hypothetical protein